MYVAYAFDYNTSKIRLASSNSHEVMLTFKLCKAKDDKELPKEICPAYQ